MAGEFVATITTSLGTVRLDSAELLKPGEGGAGPSLAERLLSPYIEVRHPFGVWKHGKAPPFPWLLYLLGALAVGLVGLALYGLASAGKRR